MKSLGSAPGGTRLERMKQSPLWTSEGFRNRQPILPGLRDPNVPMPTLTEFLFGGRRRSPKRRLATMNPLPTWQSPSRSGLRVTWLGHSTVLIEIGGIRVLTDPVWGTRASPFWFIGPKRFQPMPVPLTSMPPIDLVIISHDHYDHLDYPTIRALAKEDTAFLAPLGVGAHLEAWHVKPERITELDWWESHELPNTDVRVTATPSQHFSGRTRKSRNTTLWSSFIVQSETRCVFFSGDSGLTPQYEQIRTRYGPFDLVMLEIGGWHPAWGDMHLGPDNAITAMTLLGEGAFLPVHWGTFSLAMHPWDQPAERLLELSSKSTAHLIMPMPGQPVEPDLTPERVTPWWRKAGIDDP